MPFPGAWMGVLRTWHGYRHTAPAGRLLPIPPGTSPARMPVPDPETLPAVISGRSGTATPSPRFDPVLRIVSTRSGPARTWLRPHEVKAPEVVLDRCHLDLREAGVPCVGLDRCRAHHCSGSDCALTHHSYGQTVEDAKPVEEAFEVVGGGSKRLRRALVAHENGAALGEQCPGCA